MPANFKPLSFTTTIRNPARFKFFLKVLEKFDGEVLTNELAREIEINLIKEKIYRVNALSNYPSIKAKYDKLNEPLSAKEATKLQDSTPLAKKQRGFDRGPPSRFDTHFQIPKRLGLVYYSPPNINKEKLNITHLGKKLLNEASLENIPEPHEVSAVGEIEQSIFAHCFAKYQRKNPFTAELNHNKPVSLLLRVIKLLKEDPNTLSHAGISAKELQFLLIWKDNNAESLFNEIKDFRLKYGLNPSNEVITNKIWQINEGIYNSFQSISLRSLADEIIRKMRITGLFTLRGAGRFLDINKNTNDLSEYIVEHYSDIKNFELHNPIDIEKYFTYLSDIDETFISEKNLVRISTNTEQISYWAEYLGWDIIKKELLNLKEKRDSRHDILKIIPGPTRLEFLTTLAIKLKCKSYEVKPNYNVDDQGLATSPAPGGRADIECFKENNVVLTEVTLHRSGHEQGSNEIPKIRRHINKKKDENTNYNVSAAYITPKMHEDALFLIGYAGSQNIYIKPYAIDEFLEHIENKIDLI
ncbi:AlwI family type II restriction endonuclease [Alphaproteobacteria bacterium]|nr:AlwI family type II restriction endonuclease [Alphaproteobacteria bacterium]